MPGKLRSEKICNNCGYIGQAKMPGSGWIEFCLYIFWIFPGIIYSVWRRRQEACRTCPHCGNQNMIPAESPEGRTKLQEKEQAELKALHDGLKTLADLRKSGALTEAEFQEQKSKLFKSQGDKIQDTAVRALGGPAAVAEPQKKPWHQDIPVAWVWIVVALGVFALLQGLRNS